MLLVGLYAALAWMSLYLYSAMGDVPAVYLAAGVLWAGLMLLPARAAIVLVIGALTAQLLGEFLVYRSPPMPAVVYSISKIVEAIVGVICVRYLIGERVIRASLYHIMVFVLVGCIIVPFIFAAPPQLVRGLLPQDRPDFYLQWAMLQGSGYALMAPLIIFWRSGPPINIGRRATELLMLGLLAAAVFSLVFIFEPRFVEFNSMLYLTFPVLMWASIRFGCRGASLINLVMAISAVASTIIIGSAMLPAEKIFISVTEIEIFIIVCALNSLLLGAFAEERERALQLQQLNRERLNALSLRLVENEENYRLKIATLLHDDVGQMLAVSKIRLKLAERALSQNATLGSELALVADAIDEAIESTRRMTRDTVSTLYPAGRLQDAVEGHLHNICDGLPIEFSLECGDMPPLDKSLATVLSRCVRECIVNVMKHARARRIDVAMRLEGVTLKIDIADDGDGFDVDSVDRKDPGNSSFGLVSVENAVDALGGMLQIRSDARGTEVSMSVPLLQQDAA